MTDEEYRQRRRLYLERERARLRRRYILELIALALTAVAVAAGIIAACVFSRNKKTPEYDRIRVIVHSGETAWSIARRYCPNSVDIRDYLTQIEELNGIDFCDDIYPGQVIVFLEVKDNDEA